MRQMQDAQNIRTWRGRSCVINAREVGFRIEHGNINAGRQKPQAKSQELKAATCWRLETGNWRLDLQLILRPARPRPRLARQIEHQLFQHQALAWRIRAQSQVRLGNQANGASQL